MHKTILHISNLPENILKLHGVIISMVKEKFSSPDQRVHGENLSREISVHLIAFIQTCFLHSKKKGENGAGTGTADQVKHFMDFLPCFVLDSF